jgi:F420H(2)-dependent quinone reductase
MKNILIKWFTALNAFLLRTSGGRIGSKLGSQTILLLHHTGRKSGNAYVTPIAYFDYEGKYLVVASNWGREKQADWFLNLKAQPRAEIEIRGKRIPVEAHEAEGSEYERLWKFATEKHPPYRSYQEMTSRRIPIVIFQPVDE